MSVAKIHFAARGWILAGLLIFLLIARGVADHADAPLRPAWLLLLFAGIALRGWAGAHLGAHGNAARAQAPRLAAGGPYRFSRNPLYLSNLLVAAGLVLYANAFSPLVSWLFILAVFVHHALLIRHEETILFGIHGDAYDAYRRSTARWIGRAKTRRKEKSEPEKRQRHAAGDSLKTTGIRQGRNVVYALASAFLVWIAARAF